MEHDNDNFYTQPNIYEPTYSGQFADPLSSSSVSPSSGFFGTPSIPPSSSGTYGTENAYRDANYNAGVSLSTGLTGSPPPDIYEGNFSDYMADQAGISMLRFESRAAGKGGSTSFDGMDAFVANLMATQKVESERTTLQKLLREPAIWTTFLTLIATYSLTKSTNKSNANEAAKARKQDQEQFEATHALAEETTPRPGGGSPTSQRNIV